MHRFQASNRRRTRAPAAKGRPHKIGSHRIDQPGGGAWAGDVARRTITHKMSETEVPEDPKRVMVLDPFFTLQAAVEAGLPVVGSAVLSPDQPYPEALTEAETEGIESIGVSRQAVLKAGTGEGTCFSS